MSVTDIAPGEKTAPPVSRHDFAVDFTDCAVWFETHPDAELPEGTVINKRVYGLTYGDKVAELHRIAASWGTRVEERRDGAQYAALRFGCLIIEAHVDPPDATLADYYARIAQRKAGGTEGTEAA